MRISADELAARRAALAGRLEEHGLAGAALFDTHYVHYYTGFFFIPTERPVAFVLTADGRGGMLVPRLEVEHAQANAAISEVAHYEEYPGERHPMEALRELLDALGVRERLGADHDGYPWVFGYRGPSLGELTGSPPAPIAGLVEDLMAIKSDAELALLRESCKWANLAHTLLQRYTRPGVSETEVENRASTEATYAMLDALGPIYRAESLWYSGAMAGYRGQIGRNAAIPHALPNNIVFEAGDVLVTGATAPVWGYHSELERTMVIGPPSDEQKRMFDHMVALQDLAIDAIRPGVPCAEVDRQVRAYYERACTLGELAPPRWPRDRVALPRRPVPRPRRRDRDPAGNGVHGRARALRGGLGGFRHSDTVAVTDDGVEWLTYYPRDLESLTLPA